MLSRVSLFAARQRSALWLQQLESGEQCLDFGALVRGGIGFEPRQQLLFLYYQLRKSGHLFTVDYQRKGRSESGPCLIHQLRVPKLKPMLGPPP